MLWVGSVRAHRSATCRALNPALPIAADIDRINDRIPPGYGPVLVSGPQPAEQGWLESSKLTTNPSLVDLVLGTVTGVSARPPLYIRAEWMLERYAWTIGVTAGAFIVGRRRLPRMDPDLLMILGYADGVSLLSPRLLALPGDPDSGHPEVETISAESDLAYAMYDAMLSHLTPLVESLVELKSRPEAALWRAAGDRIAESIFFCGRLFRRPEVARDLMEAVLGRPGPLNNPLETAVNERGEEFHLRVSCCLAYRTPEGGYCRACPLNSA
ncbi:MAG: (2Fe-2S)-binding protein [Solirubrobacterales bacterium]